MKYKKIIQKPYCCVGACLEMILNRNNIYNKGQVEIAYQLGLIIPEEYKSMYPKAIIGKKPKAGYGTQIQKKNYSINTFFVKNNIDLKEKYYYIENIKEGRQFLLNNINYDILICCYGETLYNDSNANWGHMVLFESIDNNNIVTILDPYAKRDYEKVPLNTLMASISVHGKENGAGFYLIKPNK